MSTKPSRSATTTLRLVTMMNSLWGTENSRPSEVRMTKGRKPLVIFLRISSRFTRGHLRIHPDRSRAGSVAGNEQSGGAVVERGDSKVALTGRLESLPYGANRSI